MPPTSGAPTPTGAAEMAVPVKADLEAETVSALSARLKSRRRAADGQSPPERAGAHPCPALARSACWLLPRRRFDEASAGLGRGLQMNTVNKRRELRADCRASAARRAARPALHERRQKRRRSGCIRAERIVERLLQRSTSRVSSAFDAALRTLPARIVEPDSPLARSPDRPCAAGPTARFWPICGGARSARERA